MPRWNGVPPGHFCVQRSCGAILFVHLPHGLFAPNGFELPLVIGAAALAMGFNAGNRSLDHAMFGRRAKRES